MLPSCIAKKVGYALADVRQKGLHWYLLYLQYRNELFNYIPPLIVELILLQLERLVCYNTVN